MGRQVPGQFKCPKIRASSRLKFGAASHEKSFFNAVKKHDFLKSCETRMDIG